MPHNRNPYTPYTFEWDRYNREHEEREKARREADERMRQSELDARKSLSEYLRASAPKVRPPQPLQPIIEEPWRPPKPFTVKNKRHIKYFVIASIVISLFAASYALSAGYGMLGIAVFGLAGLAALPTSFYLAISLAIFLGELFEGLLNPLVKLVGLAFACGIVYLIWVILAHRAG